MLTAIVEFLTTPMSEFEIHLLALAIVVVIVGSALVLDWLYRAVGTGLMRFVTFGRLPGRDSNAVERFAVQLTGCVVVWSLILAFARFALTKWH